MAPTPVGFIGGTGRSGSTLLSRVLGAVPGVCAVGELFGVWEHGVRRDERCGCGVRFGACEFWLGVGQRAFGGWDRVDAADMLALHRGVVRARHLPLLAAPRVARAFDRRLKRYVATMGLLYGAIQAVSGCRVVLDSSKLPGPAYAARRIPGIDVRMIHLVRSPFGVCYAHTKRVPNPDYGYALMPRQRPARTAVEWTSFNLALDVLKLEIPGLLVRYEDFVAAPRAQLSRILDFLGHPADPAALSYLGDREVVLDRGHAIAGNPMRTRTGVQPLVLDEEWRTRLAPRTKAMVAALTGVGLARYGYPPWG